MIDAIDATRRFAAGRSRADLDGDQMLCFALVHALQIVGEAAGKVSAETRTQVPDVAWQPIIGMRNRLVHAYFDIDRDVLWSTVTQDLPPLLQRLRTLPLDDDQES